MENEDQNEQKEPENKADRQVFFLLLLTELRI